MIEQIGLGQFWKEPRRSPKTDGLTCFQLKDCFGNETAQAAVSEPPVAILLFSAVAAALREAAANRHPYDLINNLASMRIVEREQAMFKPFN
ncbi:MAG: hypothetical protein H7Y09_08615 [Chitinophagaceae bacterium]|nr:hypothetical protein [Anaerolineae bacterium]